MTLDPEFWRDRFHFCALMAGRIAEAEGRLDDSEYVRQLACGLYEGGAFGKPPQGSGLAQPPSSEVA